MGTFPHRAHGPERRCLPVAEWPCGDRAAWEMAQQPAAFLRQGGRAAGWTQDTRDAVVKGYGRLLTWLTITGQLAPDAKIASRLQPPIAAAFIEHLLEINAVQTVISRLNELHLLARAVEPAGDWAFLRHWQRQLRPQVTDTRNKAARLRHAVDLVDLGCSLIARARPQAGQPCSLAQAILLRDGLMIAFLALRLLRLKNLTALTIGTHLVRRAEMWWIQIPAVEMKGKRPFECSFPPVLVPALMDYLENARPLLLARGPGGQRHDGEGRLWISSGGIPLSASGVFTRITLRTRVAFGRSVYPHLFRDAAATTMAIEDPEHVGITPDLLGHRSFAINEKHYRMAKSAKAIQTYHEVLEALR